MKKKQLSANPYQREIDLYNWCKEQAQLYREGKLEQHKIDKLNSIQFDWNYYNNDSMVDME